jgi:hypothetical protein
MSTSAGVDSCCLLRYAELLGDSVRVAREHYIYAMTDYREADYSIALARCSRGAVPVLSQAEKVAA